MSHARPNTYSKHALLFILLPLQIANCTISLPGKLAVNVSLYGAPATSSSPGTTATTTSSAPTLTMINVQSSDLQVVVAASNTTTVAAVDLTKIVDTTPPVITLLGAAYTVVTQLDRFVDPGVRVYDNIDSNSITAIPRLQLCARPLINLSTIAANDSRVLSRCGSQLAAVNTTLPSLDNETYVITYTARDAAGNQAVPLRRYVTVSAK